MATNKLGKVVAGAALGGASLLVFTPGIAFADNGNGHHDHHKGKVYVDPHAVQPGHDVKFIEVCADRQEHAFVWSKVTGKVKLHARDHHKKEHERDARGEESGNDESPNGSGSEHGGWNGKDKDSEGGWNGKDSESEGGWNGHGSKNGKDSESESGNGWDSHGDEAGQPGMNGDSKSGGWGGGDEVKDDAKKKAEEEAARKKAEEEAARKKAEAEAAAEEEAAAEAEANGKDKGAEEEAAAEEKAGHKGPKFVYYGEAEIPADAEPGTYKVKGSCGEGTLVVLPTGPVDGGDGGATGGDRGMAVSGAAMLGAAALGGIVLMRRRRADELV
ncbi:hypothetical protein [Micromonospora sagamiensis]|uniref:MYXO-CTERM domain-containing protein n=1 Tax=Micromonospora sagamiensis TaxID=47875 RepID=A0A562WB69_9ACTN|nr:hypothetical protein [Micromonospora sagamiensis]TWJ27510.1 hypothetical protein JD81_01000 [Micromonospora sagamiensis]